jgi:hypothetical protein
MNEHKQKIIDEFEQEFANPDKLSSRGQFKQELEGLLYPAFEIFLLSSLDQYIEAVLPERKQCKDCIFFEGCQCDGWNACLDQIRENLK